MSDLEGKINSLQHDFDTKLNNLEKEVLRNKAEEAQHIALISQRLQSIDSALCSLKESLQKNHNDFWGTNGTKGIYVRLDRVENDLIYLRRQKDEVDLEQKRIKNFFRTTVVAVLISVISAAFNVYLFQAQKHDKNQEMQTIMKMIQENHENH